MLRVAGYHRDSKTFTRLYVENRVSREAADAEWRRGADMKAAGIACGCTDCKSMRAAETPVASISY